MLEERDAKRTRILKILRKARMVYARESLHGAPVARIEHASAQVHAAPQCAKAFACIQGDQQRQLLMTR